MKHLNPYRKHIAIILLLFSTWFVAGCQPLDLSAIPTEVPVAENDSTLTQTVQATSEDGNIVITGSEDFGVFNGISYLRYQGLLKGVGANGNYEAPFELMVPWDPGDSNGRLIIEPLHFVGGAIARNDYLTHEFLFGQQFPHAGICLGVAAPFVPVHPCQGFVGEPGMEVEIAATFAQALKTDPLLARYTGSVKALYAVGLAATANPLHTLIRSEAGQDLFDLSLFIATGWPLPFAPPPASVEPFQPMTGSGKMMVMTTEADIFQYNGAGLRIDDLSHPSYRLYEVAGGPHIAETPGTRARFVGPPQSPLPSIEGTTPLDWSPVLRALFTAADRWVTEGIEPPTSIYLESAPADEMDPVYDSVTGIARDEKLNAKGGIRLPDLALGRGQYIAGDATLMELPYMFGGFVDLQCETITDAESYLAQFTEIALQLEADGFLLADDAQALIEAAATANMGLPEACAK